MCLPDIFSLITKLQDIVYAIHLLIFTNIGIYMLHVQTVCFQFAQKSSLFFLAFFFFNAILATISHSHFALLFLAHIPFFSLRSGSRSRRMWWTCFQYFASFNNLLFYRHFTNEMYIFLLIYVATISNIKSQLASHAVIVHSPEIFWKEQSINVMVNYSISFEVILEIQEMFVVLNNKIINNFRCILVIHRQFVLNN